MSKQWTDLTDAEKLAHNAKVREAAEAMHSAQAALNEARKHLTPGGFPATWRQDSRLVTAQQADAAYEAAFQAHNALLHQYSR